LQRFFVSRYGFVKRQGFIKLMGALHLCRLRMKPLPRGQKGEQEKK